MMLIFKTITITERSWSKGWKEAHYNGLSADGTGWRRYNISMSSSLISYIWASRSSWKIKSRGRSLKGIKL